MTVNLEASNHEAGWGTVQVEDTCAVTEKGHVTKMFVQIVNNVP